VRTRGHQKKKEDKERSQKKKEKAKKMEPTKENSRKKQKKIIRIFFSPSKYYITYSPVVIPSIFDTIRW